MALLFRITPTSASAMELQMLRLKVPLLTLIGIPVIVPLFVADVDEPSMVRFVTFPRFRNVPPDIFVVVVTIPVAPKVRQDVPD